MALLDFVNHGNWRGLDAVHLTCVYCHTCERRRIAGDSDRSLIRSRGDSKRKTSLRVFIFALQPAHKALKRMETVCAQLHSADIQTRWRTAIFANFTGAIFFRHTPKLPSRQALNSRLWNRKPLCYQRHGGPNSG